VSELATFGMGCFWGVEATFRAVKGVVDAAVGYEGGDFPNPTYRDVCTDTTGLAEVVQVEYDPAQVSFDELLNVFWQNHDPTTLNRQGPDWGKQYRSVIFYHTPEQESVARASLEKMQNSGMFKRPIVTQIVPAAEFYRAEEYHQRYLEKRGLANCHIR
jgi:peptide-methionine (S)-S-oxide reductase